MVVLQLIELAFVMAWVFPGSLHAPAVCVQVVARALALAQTIWPVLSTRTAICLLMDGSSTQRHGACCVCRDEGYGWGFLREQSLRSANVVGWSRRAELANTECRD